jgi:membrane-bound metal-dependent hydrolase YbcI (DUF457 family)
MMGKTHVAFSAMATAGALPVINSVAGLGFSTPELAVGIGIGAVAGVLPDIDHPNSFITHGVIPGSRIFGPVGKAVGFLLCIPPRIVGVGARATMNHRGGTHSLLFSILWALLAAPLYAAVFSLMLLILSFILVPILGLLSIELPINAGLIIDWMFSELPAAFPLIAISVFIGYVGHLVADSLTKVPVPWPWPFSKKRYFLLPKPMRLTTGSFTETTLLRPLFVAALIVLIGWHVAYPLIVSLL